MELGTITVVWRVGKKDVISMTKFDIEHKEQAFRKMAKELANHKIVTLKTWIEIDGTIKVNRTDKEVEDILRKQQIDNE